MFHSAKKSSLSPFCKGRGGEGRGEWGGVGWAGGGRDEEWYLFDISETGIVWSNKRKNALQLQIMHLK